MPGSWCSVAICRIDYNKQKKCEEKLVYFRFPKDVALCKEWIRRCYRKDKINPKTARICSRHFKKSDIQEDIHAKIMNRPPKIRLKPNSIPTLFLKPNDVQIPEETARSARAKRRRDKELMDELLKNASTATSEATNNSQTLENNGDNAVPIPVETAARAEKEILNVKLLKNVSPATCQAINTSQTSKNQEQNHVPIAVQIIRLAGAFKNERANAVQIPVETVASVKKEILNVQLLKNVPPATSQATNNSQTLKNNEDNLKQKYKKILLENRKLNAKIIRGQKEIIKLKNKSAKDKATIIELKQEIKFNKASFHIRIHELFKHIFTPKQLDIILQKKMKVHWTPEDIAKALGLRRYIGKKCYVYLRKNMKIPLPGITTLKSWAANINLRNGLLNDVLSLMDISGKPKTKINRETILSIDKMNVSSVYEYDQEKDEVIGPYKYLKVVMARGLFDNWKQPIFVDFEPKMTKSILDDVIAKLHAVGYNVVGCTCKCGDEIQTLWKELSVDIDHSYFLHPITNEKVYIFPDSFHILQLIRNAFMATGFVLENGDIIRKHLIENLWDPSQTENIFLATQLFSHTTSFALKNNSDNENQKETDVLCQFIELISNWFDLMNSHKITTKPPYGGANLQKQNKLLEKIKKTFTSMRCNGHPNMQNFQKALLINASSVQNLFNDMKIKHKISDLLTDRLTQDCLENFFSQIRTDEQGELHNHPSPLDVIYRTRQILLGKNPPLKNDPNDSQRQEKFLISKTLKEAGVCCPSLEKNTRDMDFVNINSSEPSDNSTNEEEDGLKYIADYLAKKISPAEGEKEPPSSSSLTSQGGDLASNLISEQIREMENYFQQYNNQSLRKGKNIANNISIFILNKCPNIPINLIKSFVKLRILLRIKYLNSQNNKINLMKRKIDEDETQKAVIKIIKIIL